MLTRTLAAPAIMVLWSAHYLIEALFSDLSPMDLAAFYSGGVFSGEYQPWGR